MRIGANVRTDIDDNRKRGVRKNGTGIKIIGIARFPFTAGKEASNCQLLKIVLVEDISKGYPNRHT